MEECGKVELASGMAPDMEHDLMANEKENAKQICSPCNMTVDEPNPRVIGLEGNGDVSTSGQKDNISSGRIDEVEGLVAVHRIEGLVALSQHDDVHPMPMQRMGN